MTAQKDELLDGLITQGCTTKEVEGTTLISLPEDEAEFIFERMGHWALSGHDIHGPGRIRNFVARKRA